jgi:hypothetical protein
MVIKYFLLPWTDGAKQKEFLLKGYFGIEPIYFEYKWERKSIYLPKLYPLHLIPTNLRDGEIFKESSFKANYYVDRAAPNSIPEVTDNLCIHRLIQI